MPAVRAIAYSLVVVLALLSIGAKTSNASEFDSYAEFGSAEDPDFSGGYELPLLGITVGNGEGKLRDGRRFDGVEIVEVIPGSPAATAGLKSQRRPVQAAMTVATGLASLIFPPAIMGVSIIDSIHLGESHELIIAVDAMRTRNVLELAAALGQARPGETVYLTVVHNGQREQLPVPLSRNTGEGGF